MIDESPFPQDALEANRAGQLTPAQRKGFRGQSRGFRKAAGSIPARRTTHSLKRKETLDARCTQWTIERESQSGDGGDG